MQNNSTSQAHLALVEQAKQALNKLKKEDNLIDKNRYKNIMYNVIRPRYTFSDNY